MLRSENHMEGAILFPPYKDTKSQVIERQLIRLGCLNKNGVGFLGSVFLKSGINDKII